MNNVNYDIKKKITMSCLKSKTYVYLFLKYANKLLVHSFLMANN